MESQPVGASCGRHAGASANDTLRLALCGSFAGRIERQPPRPLCGAGLCAAILLGAGLGLALAAAGAAPAAAALLAAAMALGVHALALPWYGAVILLAVAYLLFSILPPTGRLFAEQAGVPAASIPF